MEQTVLPPNPNLLIDYSRSTLHEIWLAGGCFWGVEAFMRRVPGVAKTQVGYANGNTENPSYEQVCQHSTGHAETVHIFYDPFRITLAQLLEEFFIIIDPLSLNRQGGDIGSQYRTGIYYKKEADLDVIRDVLQKEQEKYRDPIRTEVRPLQNFYPAEEYHQSYLEKNPHGYCHIKF